MTTVASARIFCRQLRYFTIKYNYYTNDRTSAKMGRILESHEGEKFEKLQVLVEEQPKPLKLEDFNSEVLLQ